LLVEIRLATERRVVYGEVDFLSDQMKSRVAFGVVAEILRRVSVAHVEVVGMQNDCPKETDGGRGTCLDALHDHDPVLH
jgi:hypothetical protein